MAISIAQTPIETRSRKKEKGKNLFSSFSIGKKVKGKELMLFTSQLSLMLETGTSLNRALEIMAPQIQNLYFKKVITETLEHIESGCLFSEALAVYPDVFPPMFISVVKVGESGGLLKEMINQLNDYYKQKEEYVGAIKKALVYPSVLLVFCFVVILFVMLFVFPRLAVFLKGQEAMLPWTTLCLMWLSDFLQTSWHITLIVIIALGIELRFLCKKPAVASWFERQRMKIPLLNTLLIQFYTSNFLTNLGFLMRGGVPLLEGLITIKSIVGSSQYKRFIQELIESVEKGAGFSEPFRKQAFLPVTVKEMINTGEEAGNLQLVIVRLGEYYSSEFRKGMDLVCSVLEPIIIIAMGIIVGGIVLSIIIPIFRISSGAC